jgi:hypothetical protein
MLYTTFQRLRERLKGRRGRAPRIPRAITLELKLIGAGERCGERIYGEPYAQG